MKRRLITLSSALLMFAAPVLAGPVSDFETGFREAYATYRTALFATNSGDAEKSGRAITAFDQHWRGLVSRTASAPPPHYQDDPAWGDTLDAVSGMIAEAKHLAEKGELAQSHEALEHIRDAIGALHARNGIETFSDRMNAYHEKMEAVIGMAAETGTEDGRTRILEQAAVLGYLAGDVVQAPPPEAKDDAEFGKLAGAVSASVAALQAAARGGDPSAIKAAIAGLKKPYSLMFLKFG